MSTRFWKDKWVGDNYLALTFPRLFLLSNRKDSYVGDVCHVSGGGRVWDLSWRRPLFVWEEEMLQNLLPVLVATCGSAGVDSWRWSQGDDGEFSVESCYSLLERLCLLDDRGRQGVEVVFKYLWKCPAPSKVVVFSWTLLLDRIPTRVNLARRGCLGQDASTSCVFFNEGDETANHLFLHCNVVSRVWLKVLCWLQLIMVTPPNLFLHLNCWTNAAYSRKSRRGFLLIWHAVIWVIWKERNDRIFNDRAKGVGELFDNVQVLSWKWSLSRLKGIAFLSYEWCWNSRFCIAR